MIIQFTSEVLATPVFRVWPHECQQKQNHLVLWGAQAAAGILSAQKCHRRSPHLPPA